MKKRDFLLKEKKQDFIKYNKWNIKVNYDKCNYSNNRIVFYIYNDGYFIDTCYFSYAWTYKGCFNKIVTNANIPTGLIEKSINKINKTNFVYGMEVISYE